MINESGCWARFRALGPQEFLGSLGLLALFAATAVVALAIDANWAKAMRVGLSAITYLSVFLARFVVVAQQGRSSEEMPPGWLFMLAGGAAGLVSGTIRPDQALRIAMVQAAAGAFLLGGFHWWAVRMWRRVYEHLAT